MQKIKNLLSRLFDRSGKRKEPGLKFGMSVDGHDLYYYESIDFMCKFREMAIRLGYHQAELNVKIDDLVVYTDLMERELNDGNFAKCATLNTYLKMQLENYASIRVIFMIAGAGVLVDDEPADKFTPEHNKIKEELLKNKEVQAFFLNTAHNYLVILKEKLTNSEFQEYMTRPERAKRESLFLTLIGVNVHDHLWGSLTEKLSG